MRRCLGRMRAGGKRAVRRRAAMRIFVIPAGAGMTKKVGANDRVKNQLLVIFLEKSSSDLSPRPNSRLSCAGSSLLKAAFWRRLGCGKGRCRGGRLTVKRPRRRASLHRPCPFHVSAMRLDEKGSAKPEPLICGEGGLSRSSPVAWAEIWRSVVRSCFGPLCQGRNDGRV